MTLQKFLRNILTLLILPAFSFAAFAQIPMVKQSGKPTSKTKQVPANNLRMITAVTSLMIQKQHYSGKLFDQTVSREIFDEYLKTLDPTHSLFTREDVKALSKWKNRLHTMLPKGNTDFAFEAFGVMLKRTKEYQKFADEQLKKGFDFTKDETYEYDRTKKDWMPDDAALKELWRKKLKNEMISVMLSDRAAAEQDKDKKNTKKAEVPTEKKNNTAAVSVPPKKTPQERIRKRIEQITHYYEELEPIEVLELYLTSVALVFDPHSSYMSPRSEEDFDINMKLSLSGIGAQLTTEDGYTKIVQIITGGPADKDGRLKAGDRIIAVTQENGEPVDILDMPLNKVVRYIRGVKGTKVTLSVLEGEKGTQAVPVSITLTRDNVALTEQAAKGEVKLITMKDGSVKKIGVINLPSFYIDFEAARRGDPDCTSSANDVKKILKGFQKKGGIDGLVIDLRSNGGGSLLEAIHLTGLFITEGPVVQVRDKNECEVMNDDDDEVVYGGPLIVMVNRLSASASEILAAAIKDYQRGLIVGDYKTHGKGTVQIISELDRYMPFFAGRSFPAGSLRLTNAKFYRINGESTQIRGVASDIAFPAFTDSMDIGEDKLDHALPWDTIVPAKYDVYNGPWKITPGIIGILKRSSMARVNENPKFKLLKTDIAEFEKFKNRKTLSLNSEARWKEYLQEKKIREEQTKIYNQDLVNDPVLKDSKKGKKDQDLYLDETLNIMRDFISVMKPGK